MWLAMRVWSYEASQGSHEIKRIVVAYEAGRDGFKKIAGDPA